MGFSNLQKEGAEEIQNKIYALYIGDTVFISENSVTELTGPSKKKVNSVCIFFGDEDDSNGITQVFDYHFVTYIINIYESKALLASLFYPNIKNM